MFAILTLNLEEKRKELEDICFMLKEKYGANMQNEKYRKYVILRRKITRELNRRL